MRVVRMGADVAVLAPAKLNLFFEILGKRTDGFHEIETLVYPISIYDTLHFRPQRAAGIDLACRVAVRGRQRRSATDDVPTDARNLAVAALDLLRRHSGFDGGARMRLTKRIPSQAGLGGGSSDAAAAILAANTAWGLNWPTARLQEIGSELGSDVPLFLTQGPSICRGRGEMVSPVGGLGALHFVLVRPEVGLATADVYGRCSIPSQGRSVELGQLITAMRRGDERAVKRLMFNRLEEPAVAIVPKVGDICRKLEEAGALVGRMTGSGTCCFGLCQSYRHARGVAERLRALGIGRTWIVRGDR